MQHDPAMISSLEGPGSIKFASLLTRAAQAILCSAFFGVCLTTYVLTEPGYRLQVLASVVKVPSFLFVSTLISLLVLEFVNLCLRFRVPPAQLSYSAFICWFHVCLWLAALGPIVALASMSRNYSLTILAAYLSFMAAGLAGSARFISTLQIDRAERGNRRLFFATAWCLCFGIVAAYVGWSVRPLVGWTGQTFAWFRTDDTHIWNQIYCETRNISHGGVEFPAAGEASDTRRWPC